MGADLVLTSASGYAPDAVLPFLHSLRNVHQGDVVLLTDAPAGHFDTIAANYRCRVVRFDTIGHGPNVDRFLWAQALLREGAAWDHVLLVDVRDVLFQAPPFAVPPAAPLEVFLEPKLIGACDQNRRWLRFLYGAETLDRLRRNEICCAGTTFGTTAGMRRYLDAMVAEFERFAAAGRRLAWGADQAAHNHLVHAGLLGECRATRSGKGLVRNMHHEKRFVFDREGRLLNADGGVCPVLHQYDRTLDLFRGAFLRNVYGAGEGEGRSGVLLPDPPRSVLPPGP